MTYRQAAEWLEGLANAERTGLGSDFARRWDLAATERLMELLDDPHADLRAVHIAGTKGKGSVAAMVESVARAAGYTTGLFTSPHLVSWRERIRLNGKCISPGGVARLASRVRPAVEQVEAEGLRRPSFFEACTAMGFLEFARSDLDLCVVEVGLGGRLDATNVLAPVLSAITTIGIDHAEVLGDTVAEIARQKAGIIKPGTPVVVAPQVPGAHEVIAAVASERSAQVIEARQFRAAEPQPLDPDRLGPAELPVPVEAVHGEYLGQQIEAELALPGHHQAVNAGVAAAACEVLHAAGLSLPAAALVRGLEAVRWPARVQLLETRPWVIADCAHNAQSARALYQTMRRHLIFDRLILVVGLSADKPVEEFARELAACNHAVITRASLPRAMPAEELAARSASIWPSQETVPDPSEALAEARELAGSRDAICVTGSFFILDELLSSGALRGIRPCHG